MPPQLQTLDIAAVVVFGLSWLAYHLLFDGRLQRRRSLNAAMRRVRRHWMRNLLLREIRIMDSQLVGHTIHSASFFASTTIVLLAGLIGILGSADQIAASLANVSMLLHVDQQMFEWKVGLLIAIFIHAFFKFTWALRQFNYFCAVLGSAPEHDATTVAVDRFAIRMADVLTQAVIALNAGVRSYYIVFAVLGWFVHPLAFMLATLSMIVMLVRRQLFSPTSRIMRAHADALDAQYAFAADGNGEPASRDSRGSVDGAAGFR